MGNDLLWEKYRPTKLDDMVLPSRIAKVAELGMEQNNLLFYGDSGLGKTTLAGILCDSYDVKKINASLAGIDAVRNDISDFCRSKILDQKRDLKVVWLEEFDKITPAAQEALRAFIEQWSTVARFIATCNHISNITEAMRSRFTQVDFTPRADEIQDWKKGIAKRLYSIAKNEEIDISKEQCIEIANRTFPDLRSAINMLMAYRIDPVLVKTEDYSFKSGLRNLVVGKLNDINEVFKWIDANCHTEYDYLSALNLLGSGFIFDLANKGSLIDKLPLMAMVSSKYVNVQHKDPKVALVACIFEMRKNAGLL